MTMGTGDGDSLGEAFNLGGKRAKIVVTNLHSTSESSIAIPTAARIHGVTVIATITLALVIAVRSMRDANTRAALQQALSRWIVIGVAQAALQIDPRTLERLLKVLEPAQRIFTYGRGRSGFVARAFARQSFGSPA